MAAFLRKRLPRKRKECLFNMPVNRNIMVDAKKLTKGIERPKVNIK